MSGAKYHFIGNATCLDMVNTGGTASDSPERWSTAERVVEWCLAARLLGAGDAARVESALRSPVEAARFLADARRLRAACRSACEALADGRSIDPEALALLNGYLNARGVHCELSYEHGRLVRHVRSPLESPAHLLSLLTDMAAGFFTSCDPSAVRRCARPGCELWFLDSSRNGRRRWCSMQICGASDKMRRYRARRR